MKKTTLISTLAMVVIVALALTTATFAWYTSNSQVTATTTATAATSGSSNLTIADGATHSGSATTVELTNNVSMMPLVPTAATAGTTTYKQFALWGGYIAKDTDGTTDKWTGLYDGTTTNYYAHMVTIKNDSTTDAATVGVKVNWSDVTVDLTNTDLTDKTSETNKTTAKEALRIAIFEGNYTAGEGDAQGTLATLKALLSCDTAQKVHIGTKASTIEDTTAVADVNNDANGVATVTEVTNLMTGGTDTTLAAGGTVTYTIVMWFDGAKLGQSYNGAAISNIVLTFGKIA